MPKLIFINCLPSGKYIRTWILSFGLKLTFWYIPSPLNFKNLVICGCAISVTEHLK